MIKHGHATITQVSVNKVGKNLTRNRAFTLLETIVVISILLLLAALLSPVLFKAKQSAQVVGSVQRLKDLHLAIELYMLRNDDNRPHFGYYGTLGLSRESFISPCGYKPLPPLANGTPIGMPGRSYHYEYPASIRFRPDLIDGHILYYDLSCNSEMAVASRYATKRGLAVRDTGQIVNYYKAGDPFSINWWYPESEGF